MQIANFGRELTGREDALPGYARRMVAIIDPRVMALTGESHLANVEPSSNPEDAVFGTVFEVTEQELAAADKYEEAAEYRRISVTLRAGDQAWVYVRVDGGRF
ncbi:MAG TPA: gamma-glutamylcyclotransferase family protein [Bryobacteraceae bacterium]|nr:gamma-glutamylcyclotransferase family protein [Bryobacteraceae bacterium]